MSVPALNIPDPAIAGDTWPGLSITLTEDGNPIDITGAEIKVAFYNNRTLTLTLDTTSGITITNAAAGQFQFDVINRLNLNPGLHIGDLQVTFADDTRQTYCSVRLTVIADITDSQ